MKTKTDLQREIDELRVENTKHEEMILILKNALELLLEHVNKWKEDRMKIFTGVILFVLLATSASAEPNWFVRHKRFLTVVAVNTAALGVNAAGLAHCRRGDVENCTGHYGSAWGTFGLQAGLTATFVGLGEAAHKDGNETLARFLAYTPAAYNVAWGANEWHQYGPEKDTTPSRACGTKPRPLFLSGFKVALCQ